MGLKTVHCWVLAMALLAAGGALAAKKPKAAQDPDAPTAARRAPGKLTVHKAPSDESPAERARRLTRECRGRPNAGACLGFASR
ncbi:hypothetical protein JNX00_01040 [Hydrogenophaga sp. YM1]|uniref:hypothetical protein n=1 Tax=Hydrogenophaga TaxID=47420 RepID=UPI000966BEE4|nr:MULTISPECIES: hypothetical protein [unclassified Hydrogenophaga]MBN9370202.1 hypothetical protein [Hydrogenophaga sp.]OJV42594.1 MAG: hypothetical protein BGO22_09780 [Hydrogenophaga sp. 70-12]QRR34512.1 hypothetical protein JNX00_01040 [Hydrogenophaga sp. YM1]